MYPFKKGKAVKAGYGSDGKCVGVTQPRRIAASTLARRVASGPQLQLLPGALEVDDVSTILKVAINIGNHVVNNVGAADVNVGSNHLLKIVSSELRNADRHAG